MNFNGFDAPITQAAAKTYFYVSLTILIAALADHLLKSFVKVPKRVESKRAKTYVSILRSIITIIVYTIALNIVLSLLQINITPILASAGVISVIIGISARSAFEDFISGIFLLSEHSIAIDDYVKLDDVEGYIEAIGFRTLTIRGENGAMYIVPNGLVKKVVNFSRHKAHIIIDLPLKPDQSIELVLKSVQDALSELQKDKDVGESLFPGSLVNGVEDFKPAGPMLVRATIITYPARRFEVARKFRYLVKKEFEKQKILFG